MWIISDLHISHQSSLIDKRIIEFILLSILSKQPDKIIFNGDTFDFARTNILPKYHRPTKFEAKYGVNSNDENVIGKLECIIEGNEYFFDMLKRLIERGFILIFIYGNHDSELRIPSVQSELSKRIGATLGKNIFFELRYCDDKVVVEHGHQFDPENRIIYEIDDCPEEFSFGYITTKYLANIIEREIKLPPNDISAGEYFVWVFKNFGLRAFKFIFQYFIYAFRVIARSGRENIFSLARESTEYVKPIMSSPIKVIKRLYLLQVILFLGSLSVFLITLLHKSSLFYFPFLLTILSLLPLFYINNKGRVEELLNKAARDLKVKYKKEYVVFGHNHFSDNGGYNLYFSSVLKIEKDRCFVLRLWNNCLKSYCFLLKGE